LQQEKEQQWWWRQQQQQQQHQQQQWDKNITTKTTTNNNNVTKILQTETDSKYRQFDETVEYIIMPNIGKRTLNKET